MLKGAIPVYIAITISVADSKESSYTLLITDGLCLTVGFTIGTHFRIFTLEIFILLLHFIAGSSTIHVVKYVFSSRKPPFL